MTLSPGDRVEHSRFGPGTVVRVTPGDLRVRFEMLRAYELHVDPDELLRGSEGSAVLEERDSDRPDVSAHHRTQKLPDDVFEARRAIEALRFGVVPRGLLELVTVGYAELEAWVELKLSAGTSTASVAEVSGPFGSGKSHRMAVVRHVAQQQQWLTMSVEVDGNGVTLSDPTSILQALLPTASSIALDSSTPIIELHRHAKTKSGEPRPAGLRPFHRMLSNYRMVAAVAQHLSVEQFENDLEAVLTAHEPATQLGLRLWKAFVDRGLTYTLGLDTKLYPLIGKLVVERAGDFRDALLGHAQLAKLAGYRGLVVTIDEFEVETNLTADRRDRVQATLRGMVDYFRDGAVPSCPMVLFFGTATRGGGIGDMIVGQVVRAAKGEVLELQPFDEERDYPVLGSNLSRLYNLAYGVSYESTLELVDTVCTTLSRAEGRVDIRPFIKRFIAELDFRFGPGP